VHHMFGTDYQLAAAEEQYGKVRPRGWLALATGLNLAIAACYLTCKSPQTHTLSWETRLRTSVVYLLIACLVGALGTWIMLPRSSRRQFRNLARCGVRGWVFLPAIILFLQQESVWALFVAVVGAALMAAYLYRFTETIPYGEHEIPRSQQYLEKNLFTTQVRLAPTSWVPFGLSLGLYGAFLSAVAGKIILVTLLLAANTFLLVLQIRAAQTKKDQGQSEHTDRRPHLYSLIATAFFCAFIALSASSSPWRDPFLGRARVPSNPAPAKPTSPSDRSSGGYRTIVLWPIQKQEKVIPSPPLKINASSLKIAKPWIIPFYGPYWYFKVPGESPGPNARTTQGDPLKVNVHSTDRGPLLMEAHQQLSDPIDLDCCREMQIVFRNDVSVGALAVGISLTDSHSKGTQSQNLGVKYIAPSSADQPPGNTSPVEETLIFPFPKSGTIKKFDAITVILLPDAEHLTAGRKVAVERFVMIPN
jgi:uncharacterized membrane protein YeaQ/YmgE (transglycosylase-associated protein family)